MPEKEEPETSKTDSSEIIKLIVGTIPQSERSFFQKLIFRVSRGTCLFTFFTIEDQHTEARISSSSSDSLEVRLNKSIIDEVLGTGEDLQARRGSLDNLQEESVLLGRLKRRHQSRLFERISKQIDSHVGFLIAVKCAETSDPNDKQCNHLFTKIKRLLSTTQAEQFAIPRSGKAMKEEIENSVQTMRCAFEIYYKLVNDLKKGAQILRSPAPFFIGKNLEDLKHLRRSNGEEFSFSDNFAFLSHSKLSESSRKNHGVSDISGNSEVDSFAGVTTPLVQRESERGGEGRVSTFTWMKAELLYAKYLLQNLSLCVQSRGLLSVRFWIPSSQVPRLHKAVGYLSGGMGPYNLTLSEVKYKIGKSGSHQTTKKPLKARSLTLSLSDNCLGSKSGDCDFQSETVEALVEELDPPTSFSSNIFLKQFQNIVDTYGVPSYKEVNPAVFTAVTFPFLFGVMFGDIAHGSILLGFSVFMLVRRKWLSQVFAMQRRVITSVALLLMCMAGFSIYAGAVYNDFMALPVTLFPSCYVQNGDVYGNYLW